MGKRLSAEQENEIIAEYTSGLTMECVADKTGRSFVTVRNVLKRRGVPNNPVYPNLVGKTFGELTVLSLAAKSKNGGARWLCRCSCGNKVERLSRTLKAGRSPSCLQCDIAPSVLQQHKEELAEAFEAAKTGPRGTLVAGAIPAAFWNRFIRGANIRKIPFYLTPEEAWVKYQEQHGLCRYTNRLLTLPAPGGHFHTASIDRINSDLPYTADNIQWIHKDLQRMKGSMPEDEFLRLCRLVTDATGQDCP